MQMLNTIKHIFSQLWHLTIEAPETWEQIAKDDTEISKIRNRYTFCLIALCVLLVFAFNWLLNDIQYAIATSLRDLIVLTGGYYIICLLGRTTLKNTFPNRFNLEDSDKIITYCYAFIIILQFFISIIPISYYLYLLYFFVAYLLWEAARAVLLLEEDERQYFVIYFTLIITIVPIILTIAFNFLILRNI